MELSLPLSRPRDTPVADAEITRAGTAAQRWMALDVFRFAAVLLMVQGHIFTALIADAVRSQAWYSYHNYVHGFTAPMFLFGAGLAFGLTTFRRWHDHIVISDAVRKRLIRYVGLILIGYAMHVPGWSWWSLASASPVRLQRALKVDALQHIGVCLLICQVLVRALRDRTRFVIAMAALTALTVLLGPWAWRLPAEDMLPLVLASYVNANTGSIFPLFPWAGFIFSGIVTAHCIERLRSARGAPGEAANGEAKVRADLALVGGICAAAALALDHNGFNPFGPHYFWKTSPVFFLWRLGVLLTVLAVLCQLEATLRKHWPQALGSSALRQIQLMGQESLVVYVAHILLLYNTFWGFNLAHRHARSLDLVSGSLLATAMILAMWGLAVAWRRVHVKQPSFGRALVCVVALGMLIRGL